MPTCYPIVNVNDEKKNDQTDRARLNSTRVRQLTLFEKATNFFTSNDHEELIVRNKDFFDNATPSGNSVAADVLLKLLGFCF